VGSLATSALFIFLVFALIGAAAFVLALLIGRYIRSRPSREGHPPGQQRQWGGRDYARVRTKYFEKEARARAARARARTYRPPDPSPPEEVSPDDPEYVHRETLGLLGVELSAEVVRDAYKQRVREYHPDRVVALGVKIRLLAEEETKRVNEAYRFLRSRYGW
jgi:hypothetical protein